MKSIRWLGPFRKDHKRIVRRKYRMEKLEAIVQLLRDDEPLPISARSHKLTGEYDGFWECHLGPDWLLIYDSTDTEVLLARTGTHADLFE